MKNRHADMPAKRIAIVAPAEKRKALIEWSYYNKDMLGRHNLIASAGVGRLLEGTVNKPVQMLSGEDKLGFHQLAELMQDRKVDIIFFFENPMKAPRPDNALRKLLETALDMNIVIASDRSNMDFIKATA